MPQIIEVPGIGEVEFPDNMTDDQITAVIRKQSAPQQPFPDVYGGAGGYNPMLSNVIGLTQRTGQALGMTPENVANPVANATGPAETALQFGTGSASFPIAGIAGLGQGIKNIFSPGMSAADRVAQVRNAMTYQPRTGAGQAMSSVSSVPSQIYEKGTDYLGEKTTDVTGSPAAGAFVKTLGDLAPSLIGARSLPKRSGPRPTGTYEPTKFDIPTTEQLKQASQEAYKQAGDAGIVVPAESYTKAVGSIVDMAKKEGINPTLHPKSTAVLKELDASQGKPLTLQEAETLRKIALDAEDDLNPVTRQPTPDARLAGKIVDELDTKIEALSANDQARSLWARSRRSQMIDRAISRAEIKAGAHYTQAGMEHALRQEFKQLALNERRMRGLTKDQQAAIRKVAAGGPIENTLRYFGKFDPLGGNVAAFVSLATSAGLSPLTGGISMGLPVLGFGGKRLATKMTANNVDAARAALVGRGIPSIHAPIKKPVASTPAVESLPFTLTPGVLPAKTGPLSRGIELAPQPMFGAQQFPPYAARPGDLTAYTPAPMPGGLDFKPTPNIGLAGDLSVAPPNPSYPGGVDFTPSKLPPQIPRDLALALLDERTQATPAKAARGSLDLPAKSRSSKEIREDIRRLSEKIRALEKSGATDPLYVRALSDDWTALQNELAASQANR